MYVVLCGVGLGPHSTSSFFRPCLILKAGQEAVFTRVTDSFIAADPSAF